MYKWCWFQKIATLLFLTSAQSSETSEKTSWDDDDRDDEKLKALAKKFEEKYVSCIPFAWFSKCLGRLFEIV